METYLLGLIGREPMTFKQILDIACPEGTFDGDMARELGASNVGITRSLRRALFTLCKKGVFKKIGIKAPYNYQLSQVYLREGDGVEFNPKLIGLIYRCVQGDRLERVGKLLLEARPQIATDEAWRDYIKQIGMTEYEARRAMDMARSVIDIAARHAKSAPPEAA